MEADDGKSLKIGDKFGDESSHLSYDGDVGDVLIVLPVYIAEWWIQIAFRYRDSLGR